MKIFLIYYGLLSYGQSRAHLYHLGDEVYMGGAMFNTGINSQ